MGRRYTREEYLERLREIRSIVPGLAVSTDIIVGFPGETEEEFEDTLSLVEEAKYASAFTFIYSPRPGTPAAKMEDPTPHKEKTDRMARLLKTQEKVVAGLLATLVGETVRVLVEGAGRTPGTLNGRLDNNLVVEFQADESLIGRFAEVKITAARAALLLGERV